MRAVASDVIDHLAGIDPGSRLDGIRGRAPQIRGDAQQRHRALFQCDDEAGVTRQERHVVAAFVAGLHREPSIVQFYGRGMADPDGRLARLLSEEVFCGAARGPYGRSAVPPGAKGGEGMRYRVLDAHRPVLGRRLAAALEHAHLLVFHPGDAGRADLRALEDAGWPPEGIVTLSQLVAFLVFQIRAVAGLRVLDVA
ncbi:CMD domain protein [Labrys monachus]|uniref:CMD domain protein n=1 Tax=Labrys monachus TaxID=217067 RepID=A0ABU0FCE2_9HYPH|nr:CMD domain protein [Labrys monachus]MDQ0392288.1 CMD domain protein [Labrys monachus]